MYIVKTINIQTKKVLDTTFMEYPEEVEDALEELWLGTNEEGFLLFEDLTLKPYRIFYLHHLSIQQGEDVLIKVFCKAESNG